MAPYFSFRGRANRREFWGFLFFWVVAEILLFIGAETFYESGPKYEYTAWAFLTAAFLLWPPMIAAGVRRLHDTERSGWWLWIDFIPLLGPLVLLIFWFQKGTDGLNHYDFEQRIQWAKAAKILAGSFGVLAGLALGFAATQISWRPVEIRPETFYVTEPRLENGNVDYFAVLMQNYTEIYAHPEQNGFLTLEKALEDANLMGTDDFPDSESADFAEWATQHSALFDVLSESVQKPAFLPVISRPTGSLLTMDLYFHEVVRILARMQIRRVFTALETGRMDEAVAGTLTLHRMGRHWEKGPGILYALVGMAMEGMGNSALKHVILSGKMTDEQLARLESELEALPERQTFRKMMNGENLILFDCLQELLNHPASEWNARLESPEQFPSNRADKSRRLFVDENVIRTCFYDTWSSFDEIASETDSVRRTQRFHEFEEYFRTKCRSYTAVETFVGCAVSLKKRSKITSFMILGLLLPCATQAAETFQRNDAMFRLARLAIQLERFKLRSGCYPLTLEEVEGADLFDPFTGKKTITYIKQNPVSYDEWKAQQSEWDENVWSPYLLYSFGADGKDGGGVDSDGNDFCTCSDLIL